MTGLEIIFTLSTMALLFMWGWFIILAFRTSRLWGIGLILLFPLSPFMFAYRFERKTRKIVYYFLGSFVLFAAVNGWIFFATIDFFDHFTLKISKVMPNIDFSEKAKPIPKPLNLPKPTPIPDAPVPTAVEKPAEEIKEPVEEQVIRRVPKRGYKTVSIDNARNYIGKNVIITTAIVVHRGKLQSVGMGQVEIKKEIAGGSTVMGVSKSKIEKFEVYL